MTTRAEKSVLAERARQRQKWDAHHDDELPTGDLAVAATVLAEPDDIYLPDEDEVGDPKTPWAFRLLHKHRADRRRQLVIAAALLIAEIDKMDRASP